MKRTLALSVAAPCCALAILLAACTGSGSAVPEDDQPIEQPAPQPETPDDPDTPDNPDDPDTPDDPDNPDNPGEEEPAYKTVKEVLQEIFGDDYNDISGEISQNKNITLTAQTIDAVSDIFSDSKSAKEKFNNLSDKDYDINQVKTALVAQAENKITLKRKSNQYKVISGKTGIELDPVIGSGYEISAEKDMKVSLEGEFKYFSNHIESLSDNIDISGITISSQQDVGENHYDTIVLIPGEDLKKEISNKLNLEGKNPESLPALAFGIGGDKEIGLKYFLDIYDKYNKSEKLNIDAYFGSMDGRKLVDVDNYTLFESDDGNTAKEHNNSSIRSFEINELIDFADKYHISNLSNLIIYGDAKTAEVDWQLTNIIFEGNMSKVTNISTKELKGIVYFKDLPYDNENVNNNEGQEVAGAVRLDKLSSSIKLINKFYSILDVRAIDQKKLEEYNQDGKYIHGGMGGMYFNEQLKDFAEKKKKLYPKFTLEAEGGYINNVYFGDSDREDGVNIKGVFPTSKKPRKLSEFEYYGNNSHYEHAAVESYNDDFSSVTTDQRKNLENDKGIKKIAKVTTLCPLC